MTTPHCTADLASHLLACDYIHQPRLDRISELVPGRRLGLASAAELTSYRTARLATAVLSLAGAIAIRAGRRMVRRSRGLPVRRLPRRGGSPAAPTYSRQGR